MGIYAHKVKGVATGRLRIEVVRDGKRHVRYSDTKKGARKIEAMLKLGVAFDADTGAPAAYTVDDLKADYRGLWAGTKDEAQSTQRFYVALEALRKALGATPLADVEEDHLQRTRDLLLRGGPGEAMRKGATVNRYLAALSKALNWAEAKRKIKHRPRFKAIKLKDEAPIPFSLSETDEERLQAALMEQRGDDYVLISQAQIAMGTRISELLKLTPDCITRMTEGNDAWYEVEIRDTKSGKPRVSVLTVELGERLKDLVERGMPHYAAIRRAMRFARKAAGLPLTQPTHAHRHTTATRMTARGVSMATVMDVLGHQTIQTTRRYITTDTRSKRAALAVLLRKDDVI